MAGTIMSVTTVGALRALFTEAGLAARTRGSTTEKGLDAVPADREAIEFRPPPAAVFGGARYFRVSAPEVQGRVGAVPLSQVRALRASKAGEWVDARGHYCGPELKRRSVEKHDDELYLDVPPGTELLPACATVTVIVGPTDADPTLFEGWTWHPGEPLAPLARGATPTGDTAVKVHNGK